MSILFNIHATFWLQTVVIQEDFHQGPFPTNSSVERLKNSYKKKKKGVIYYLNPYLNQYLINVHSNRTHLLINHSGVTYCILFRWNYCGECSFLLSKNLNLFSVHVFRVLVRFFRLIVYILHLIWWNRESFQAKKGRYFQHPKWMVGQTLGVYVIVAICEKVLCNCAILEDVVVVGNQKCNVLCKQFLMRM